MQFEGLNTLLLMHERYRGETDAYFLAFLRQWYFIRDRTDGLSKASFAPDKTGYKIRDLWATKEAGTTGTPFVADVPPHDVVMLRLSK